MSRLVWSMIFLLFMRSLFMFCLLIMLTEKWFIFYKYDILVILFWFYLNFLLPWSISESVSWSGSGSGSVSFRRIHNNIHNVTLTTQQRINYYFVVRARVHFVGGRRERGEARRHGRLQGPDQTDRLLSAEWRTIPD